MKKNNELVQTYQTDQPWVVYTFGLTHDNWWPLWGSTRVLGYFKVKCTCCVCGEETIQKIALPRFKKKGDLNPDKTPHPFRVKFLAEHAHPDRGHPMSWKMPLHNLAVFKNGLDLDLLAARLEADLNHPEADA